MNSKYIVSGWSLGNAYEMGLAADYSCVVNAENESQAEDLGDKKIETLYGKCEVIVAELVS